MRDFSIIKQRILQYLEFKGISKYECYQKTGITNGVFSQKSGISEDNLLSFLSYYRDISTDWLLTGRGEMLRRADGELSAAQSEATIIYRGDPRDAEIIQLQRDQIKLLKEKLNGDFLGGAAFTGVIPPTASSAHAASHEIRPVTKMQRKPQKQTT